ncbi:NAD-dependent DNA ligase LigA [[Mycoplasma] gypis]|uniref:DNA ligase n=1 Tax=[Mycoplasma] gypis TaxID=92404 RepID=A0ABZ2RPG2_9BACT|nr:NAD-dependent DNA ligase LigA [[Mycoplasma] gypis]MBN0919473.1 NAD-dependent DNA ligase LigA [[Mycoplasma] gypis]
MKNKKQEIIELQNQIKAWNQAYFDKDEPLVEDAIYDKELVRLKQLEEEYKDLFTEQELKNSPTNNIGAQASSVFQKVVHKEKMLSLQKAYEKAEVLKWIENIEKLKFIPTFYIEPKIDGLSIALHYKNGKLVQALTRGDGTVGEDVTHNILVNNEIPLNINYFEDIEIRGEIYLKLSEFEKINIQLQNEGKKPLVNPRNGASGTLRQLNPEMTQKRNLSVYCYWITDAQRHNLHSIEEIRSFLAENNFPVTKEGKKVLNIEEIFTWINDFKTLKKTLDYETDGVVIKLNEIKYYDLLGQTQKFPRWAIAFKYEPDTAVTLVKSIFPTVGRTGIITYNAELEPVFLGGSTISAATLHNYDYIKKLNIDINDLVYIKKAGEIIPKVIGTVKNKTSTLYNRATQCPKCFSSLVDSETAIDQYCQNPNCPEVLLKKLIHFVSKPAMNIDTLGEKIVTFLFNNNYVKSYKDFYYLKEYRNEIMQFEGFKEKKIDKILENIEASKQNGLAGLLFGISIKHIGEKAAYFLASKIETFSNFLEYDFNLLADYDGFSEKTIDSLKEFVAIKENQEMVKDLLDLDLNLKHQSNQKSLELSNLVFVITGTFNFSRKTLEKELISRGAKIASAVSKNTNYLIVGQNPGSKLAKARALETEILEFDDLKSKLGIEIE